MVADFLLLISANIFAVALIVVYLVSALTRWNRVLRISGSAVVALAVASHQLLVSYGSYQGDNIPAPFFYLTVFLTNLIFFLIPLALGVVCVSLALTSFRVIKRYNYFGLNVYNWPVIGAILRRYEHLKVQEFLAAERQRLRKEASSLERKIETQRRRVEELKAAFETIDPTDYQALEAQQERIKEVNDLIDELETSWLEVSEQLESN